MKYLVIGDIHLGHPKTPTTWITDNLQSYLTKQVESNPGIVALFIAGDLFHRLLVNTEDAFHDSVRCIYWLFSFCERHDLVLRVLEGTPSHDYRQAKLMEIMRHNFNGVFNFKYIDCVDVEIINELGKLRILYVPDRPMVKASDTLKQVHAKLAEEGMDGVDIAIMHGMFNYQCPEAIGNIEKHNEEDYLSIVTGFIHIGHVHSFSQYSRIIAEGSFDRLAHGEEEPKGGVIVDLGNYGSEPCYFFVENTNAKIYKTIEIKGTTVEAALSQIEKATRNVPSQSYIRLKAKKQHPILSAFEQLKVEFPQYSFSRLGDKEEETATYLLTDPNAEAEEVYTPISMDRNNIVDLLMHEVKTNNALTYEEGLRLTHLLEKEL